MAALRRHARGAAQHLAAGNYSRPYSLGDGQRNQVVNPFGVLPVPRLEECAGVCGVIDFDGNARGLLKRPLYVQRTRLFYIDLAPPEIRRKD